MNESDDTPSSHRVAQNLNVAIRFRLFLSQIHEEVYCTTVSKKFFVSLTDANAGCGGGSVMR